MRKMSVTELKDFFLQFFSQKKHTIIPSASLIPDGDDVLFTTAGMHPLIPYLAGAIHQQGPRLVNIQNVVRTGALDRVGEDSFCTFFELFGNWSLGDYDWKTAIMYAWEFLTDNQWLNIPPEHLHVTCFSKNTLYDDKGQIHKYWLSLKVPESHIYDFETNWKGPYSKYAICGPNTKIFFDTGKEKCNSTCNPLCPCGKYVELWDIVFLNFALRDNVLSLLPRETVDTGMGVERLAAVLQQKESVFETDLLFNIIQEIQVFSPCEYDSTSIYKKQYRIVADHLRCAAFIMAEGIIPSSNKRGYVLRRIIRRMINAAYVLKISPEDIIKLMEYVINLYSESDPELHINVNFILDNLRVEIETYILSLNKGVSKFYKLLKSNTVILVNDLFNIHMTFGVPLEILKMLADDNAIEWDQNKIDELVTLHRIKSTH